MERIDWRAATAPACLIGGGTFAGWVTSAVLSTNQLTGQGYSMREGNLTASLAVGLLLAFVCISLAQGLLIHRSGSRHVRAAKQQNHTPVVERRSRSRLDNHRRRQPTLQDALSQPLQVHSHGEQQYSQPGLTHPGTNPTIQSHLLGVFNMATKSSPRPALIVDAIDGLPRSSAHGPAGNPLTLTLIYQPDRPYASQIVISNARNCPNGPTHGIETGEAAIGQNCNCDLTPWLVSREVLCIAAVWRTPAGMGDFRAVPMGNDTVQLVFQGSDPDNRDESLHIDVDRKSLMGHLKRTMRAVPPGTESQHVDIDRALAALVGDMR